MSPHASASQPMDGEPIAGCGRWWGGPAPPVATPTSTDVMNQLCRVCGEPAAGFHFGAFTCEGCKSFFGRTYNNLSSISECKNNGCCVINKKNRTSCKACRLRKCLMVGMSKSGSRYGRRSNWFKIHCLLQEQQQQHTQQQQQQQQKGGNVFFPPNSVYPQEAFFNGHLHTPRKHEDTSSEDSANSSPHPQTSPAFFPNPSLFLPSRFAPDTLLNSRKRKHPGGDSSSEDSTHSSSQNNLSSPHPQTPPMFFPNPALFLPSRFPPDPLLHSKLFEDNSSVDSAKSSRNNNKLPLGFYPNPNLFLPLRLSSEAHSDKRKTESSSESSGGEESESDVFHRQLSAKVMLTSTPSVFAPQRLSVTKPGLTPSHGAPLDACSGRSGGDSPAIGGVPLDQDQPIDLSLKTSSVGRDLDQDRDRDRDQEAAKRGCKDGVLDLTNKRTANVMF